MSDIPGDLPPEIEDIIRRAFGTDYPPITMVIDQQAVAGLLLAISKAAMVFRALELNHPVGKILIGFAGSMVDSVERIPESQLHPNMVDILHVIEDIKKILVRTSFPVEGLDLADGPFGPPHPSMGYTSPQHKERFGYL